MVRVRDGRSFLDAVAAPGSASAALPRQSIDQERTRDWLRTRGRSRNAGARPGNSDRWLRPKRARLANGKQGRGRLMVYNIFDEDASLLNAYDMILLMDVVEHIDDDLFFLNAALKHLKPGGIVAINVPAHMRLYSKYDEVAGHKRRYNTANIKELFRAAKVEPISIVQWGFSLMPLLLARKAVLSFVSRERTIRIGFASPNILLRRILGTLQSIETHMPFSMPLGSSILAIGQRH